MAVQKDFKEETGLMCTAEERAAHCVFFLSVRCTGLILGEEKEVAVRHYDSGHFFLVSTFQSVPSPLVT